MTTFGKSRDFHEYMDDNGYVIREPKPWRYHVNGEPATEAEYDAAVAAWELATAQTRGETV